MEGLIKVFQAGYLAIPDGTSLRRFLASMLNCNPKRISKKFEGSDYARGRKFYLKSSDVLEPEEAQVRRDKLNNLERKYKAKLRELHMPHLFVGTVGTGSGLVSFGSSGDDEGHVDEPVSGSLIQDSATVTAAPAPPSAAVAPNTTSFTLTSQNPAPLSSARIEHSLNLNQQNLQERLTIAGSLTRRLSPPASVSSNFWLTPAALGFGASATGRVLGETRPLNDRMERLLQAQQHTGSLYQSNTVDIQRRFSSLGSSVSQYQARGLDALSLLAGAQRQSFQGVQGSLQAEALLNNDLQAVRRQSLLSSISNLNSSHSSLLQQRSNSGISLEIQRLLQNQQSLNRVSQDTSVPPSAPFTTLSVLDQIIGMEQPQANMTSPSSLLQSRPHAQALLQLQLLARQQDQRILSRYSGRKRKAEDKIEGKKDEKEHRSDSEPRRKFNPGDDGAPPGGGSGWV